MISILLKITGAKKALEVGVFTGYSLLLTALTIPKDGKPKNEGSFDYAFVDAEKINYINYHERIMKLVKVNGIVVYDNTLWFGMVLKEFKEGRASTIEFNKSLAADPRIHISTVPLGDGITIHRRLY
ncbi:probable caffeoyl-CoA O-methyltransferase isoform X2 [Tanacetum coccineum]